MLKLSLVWLYILPCYSFTMIGGNRQCFLFCSLPLQEKIMTKLGAGEGRPLCSAQHVKNRGLIIQEYVGVKVAGLFRLFAKGMML